MIRNSQWNTLNIEAVAQTCSVKKVFLESSQNSQENTCARVSFLIKLQEAPATLLKKRLWHRCFPVNFAKFLRTAFFAEHLWWLLPSISIVMTRSYLILLLFDIAILTWYFDYVCGIIICNVHKFGQFGLCLYAPVSYSPFKRQSYKMIKHSQTSLSHELEFSKKFIADELFECV